MKRIRKSTEKEAVIPLPRKKIHNGIKEKLILAVQTVSQVEQAKLRSAEWHTPSVTLSLRDRASQLILSDDQMTCIGVEVQKCTFIDSN